MTLSLRQHQKLHTEGRLHTGRATIIFQEVQQHVHKVSKGAQSLSTQDPSHYDQCLMTKRKSGRLIPAGIRTKLDFLI